jgi:DNA-binding MarR family transcriptional regulator
MLGDLPILGDHFAMSHVIECGHAAPSGEVGDAVERRAGAGIKPAAAPSNATMLALLRLRRLRAVAFSGRLFAQPAWDMLLELLECDLWARRTSVSSLYLAAGVPPATALRRLNDMEAAGLVRRTDDPRDRRRQFVELTPGTRAKLTAFFEDAQVQAALQIDERHLHRR